MGRDEHLAWCKRRALEYLDAGDIKGAGTSMMSDLRKHPDFDKPVYGMLNQLCLLHMANNDHKEMRRWIEGFN